MKIKSSEVLRSAENLLRKSKIPKPRLESEILLSHVLACARIDLLKQEWDDISLSQRDSFMTLIQRRSQHEPLAYLLGYKEFYGRKFFVSSETLIPRPETELLVEEISNFFGANPQSEPSLIDLGTGTGCIALSLALENPNLQVSAVDVSESALEIAQRNLESLPCPKNHISLWAADVLAEAFWENLGSFDVIVSNPPYIGEAEKVSLEPNVLDFEPHGALFAENNGLHFYEIFAQKARSHLKPGGRLYLELSPVIFDSVKALFLSHHWDLLEVIEDYAGHKRHIVLS